MEFMETHYFVSKRYYPDHSIEATEVLNTIG